MTTITTIATSSADGWLRLQVPEVLRGQPLEVVAIMQPATAPDAEAPARRQRAFAALERLAHLGGITGIPDPATWQRTQRLEKPLAGRED